MISAPVKIVGDTVLQPKMSEYSKVFWKEPYKLQPEAMSRLAAGLARPTIHGGKLTPLMDMPADIFLEVYLLAYFFGVTWLTSTYRRSWLDYTLEIY